jgi:hypothetical protein
MRTVDEFTFAQSGGLSPATVVEALNWPIPRAGFG